MKTTIKLTALFLLATGSLFAAVPSKIKPSGVPLKNDVITFSSLRANTGIDIKVEKNEPGKAIVIIYDQDKNVLFKDALPDYKTMEKGYILNQLDNGDYTIEVTANKQVVTKQIHVYDEDNTKAFLVKE